MAINTNAQNVIIGDSLVVIVHIRKVHPGMQYREKIIWDNL